MPVLFAAGRRTFSSSICTLSALDVSTAFKTPDGVTVKVISADCVASVGLSFAEIIPIGVLFAAIASSPEYWHSCDFLHRFRCF